MARSWPTNARIGSTPDSDLVSLYAEAAAATDDLTGTREQNAAATCVGAIYSELRRRGSETQRLLLPLLRDERPGVHGWASAHALEIEPRLAERRLHEIAASEPFPHGFDAKMVLEEWRNGRLTFPDPKPRASRDIAER